MNRSLLLSGLFLLGCWLIAAADSPDGPESKATEPEELPERAVFEVHMHRTVSTVNKLRHHIDRLPFNDGRLITDLRWAWVKEHRWVATPTGTRRLLGCAELLFGCHAHTLPLQWKVFAHKVHNGRYGKRVVRSL